MQIDEHGVFVVKESTGEGGAHEKRAGRALRARP